MKDRTLKIHGFANTCTSALFKTLAAFPDLQKNLTQNMLRISHGPKSTALVYRKMATLKNRRKLEGGEETTSKSPRIPFFAFYFFSRL